MFEEVLGESFSVFFKNLSRYALLVAVIIVPLLVLQITFTMFSTGAESYTQQMEAMNMFKHFGDPAEMEEYTQNMEDNEQPSPFVAIFVIIGGIILFIGGLLLNAAIVLATDDYYQQVDGGLDRLVTRAARKLLGVIGLAILMGLSCMIGFVLLIIPGIILLVKFSLALPIYVLEDVSVFTAISRSFQMTKGNSWPIFGTVLVLIIVGMLVGFIASMVMLLPAIFTSSMILYIAGMIISNFLQMTVGCIFIVAIYLFYAKISGRISTKGKLEPNWEVSQ